jgi:IS66 C-terminal element
MNGAQVGDLFMSLIRTCELNQVNPFDYLTELLRHPAQLKSPSAPHLKGFTRFGLDLICLVSFVLDLMEAPDRSKSSGLDESA